MPQPDLAGTTSDPTIWSEFFFVAGMFSIVRFRECFDNGVHAMRDP